MLNATEKTFFKKLVRTHKDYGFTSIGLSAKLLARLIELELVTKTGENYQVTPKGVEVYATI